MAITITCLIWEPGAPCPGFFPGRSWGVRAVGLAASEGAFCVAASGTVRSGGGGSGVRPQAALNNSAQIGQRRMNLRRAQRKFEQCPQFGFTEGDRVRLEAPARALDHARDVDLRIAREGWQAERRAQL